MNDDTKKLNCANCGIPFWIETGLLRVLKESHNSFFCPKGHAQHFTGESDAEKCKRYKKLMDNCNSRNSELYEENSKLSKSIKGYKGVIGRLKKHDR